MKASGQVSFLRFCLLMLMLVSYTDTYVFAKPRGGQVVSGAASFTQDGNLTVITAGNRSIINYQTFDIAKGETVQFVQPNAHSTVLNRVLTPDPTNIFGTLESNGIVIIANPYGVFFQNGAVVNVGGLIAGAGQISNADFAAGKVHFTDLTGDVRNDGVIAADNRIALMGANVVNTGSLTAAHGMAMMVSGSDVYVGDKNGNIFVQANGKALRAAAATGSNAASAGSIANSGTVSAPRVVLGAGDMYSTAIVNSGLLQGRSIAVNAGRNGSATIGGTLDATSAHNPSATGKGGHIDVLGGTVALQGATLDASGAAGGGNVRVGGDFHGAGTLAHATDTTVDAASTIRADATGATGDGGTVVLWSDSKTLFSGSISTQPGAAGGTGGQVEVSSHDALGFHGLVNTGATGSLLLDPSNIEITPGGGPVATNADPISDTENTPSVILGVTLADNTTTVSQASLEATTGAITLSASNDIKVDPGLTNGGLKLMGTADAAFHAGVNTSLGAASSGSFVIPTNEFITNAGHNITITASGVSVGGTLGINANNPFAIQTGDLNTNTTTGAGGGTVALQITSGSAVSTTNPAPIVTGNINTGSSVGAGGNITINGNAANNAPNGVTTGNLTASATGMTGAGGTVTLSTSGANGAGTNALAVGFVDSSSVGGAGGPVSLTISPTNAVTTGNLVAPMGVAGVTTTSAASLPGSITIGGAGTTLPTILNVGPATNTAATVALNSAATGAGNTAAGGAVTLGTSGALNLTGTTNASSAGAAGGAILLVSTGGDVTSTGSLTSTSGVATTGAAGTGSATVDATGVVKVGTANATGVNAIDTSSASGPGGAVMVAGITVGMTPVYPTSVDIGPLTNTNTAANVINSSATGTAAGATGVGGAVNVTSSGVVTLHGATNAGSSGAAGGAINVTSTGAQVAAGNLATTAAGQGGAITIKAAKGSSTADAISLSAIDASSTGGNGGPVALQITSPTAVSLANPAPVTAGAINTSSSAGSAGNITINGSAANNSPNGVTTGDLTANATGTTGAGGTVAVSTSGADGLTGTPATQTNALSVGVVDTSSAGGAGGPVNLTIPATNAVAAGNLTAPMIVGGVTTTSAAGAAGSITIGAAGATLPTSLTVGPATNPAATVALDATSTGTAGNAAAGGTIILGTSGLLTIHGSTDASSTGAAGGPITLVSTGGGFTATGNLKSASAAAGAAGTGSVLVEAEGGVSANAIDTSSAAGPGGPITIAAPTGGTAPTSITVGVSAGSDPATTDLIDATAAGTGANSGAGGAISLTASGGITLYGATSAASTGGAGGAVSLVGGGAVGTGNLVSTSGAATMGAGGTGSVSAITTGTLEVNGVQTQATTGPGGAITLGSNTAQPTSIKTHTPLTSTGTTAGGNISLVTKGAITLGDDVTASATAGAGGTISMLGKGALTGTDITTNSVGGTTPGSITVGDSTTANPAFTPSSINLSGALSAANTGTAAGNGGAVQLLSTGAVQFAAATTTSAAGAGGAVTVGGKATDGTSVVPTGITVGGAITTSATATTGAGGAGGAVSLQASGAAGAKDITTLSGLATGGNIGVSGGTGATVGALVSTGPTKGGDVTLAAGTGALSLTSATTSSNGTAGGITLSGAGITSNGALTATGNTQGGSIAATSNGGITVSGAINSASTNTGGTLASGNVRLLTGTTPGAVSVQGITTTSSGTGNAGSITIGPLSGTTDPTSITLNGALAANAPNTGGGAGGPVALTSSGAISGGGAAGQPINASSASVAGGAISAVSTGGAVTVGALTSSGQGAGNGGNVTVTTGGSGALAVGAIDASATTSGNGGAVALTSASTLGTSTINASATGSGAGGNVTVKAVGAATIGGSVNTSTTGAGAGGSVNFLAESTNPAASNPFVTQDITTSSGSGAGGSITVAHDAATASAQDPASITVNGPLTTTGPTGDGPIVLESRGAVTLATTAAAPTRETFTGDTTITGTTVILQDTDGNPATTPTFDLAGHNLTLTLSGDVLVDGSITTNGTGKFDNVKNFTSNGTGSTTIDGDFTTEESQTYASGITRIAAAAPPSVTLTAGSTITDGTITFGPATAAVPAPAFNDSANFAHDLTLITGTASAGLTISQPVGTTHPFLSLTAVDQQTNNSAATTNEPVKINAQTVAAGTQTYGTLTLGGTGATTLTSTRDGGSITSNGAVTATGQAFNVNATGANGATNFTAIGTAGATDFEVAGLATFAGAINAASFALGKTVAVTTATQGLFTAGNAVPTVSTSAGQTYGEPVLLGAATTLTDTGSQPISLALVQSQTMATAFPLTVSTGGAAIFNGTVGAGGFPLLSLAVTDATTGSAQLNGGSVHTSGVDGQVYSGPVTLGAATTLTADSNGVITFQKTLASAQTPTTTPQALTITTGGVTTFDGVVGGDPGAATDARTAAPALASLTFTAGGGAVDINGPAAGTSVTTVTTPGGTQNYGTSQVVLGTNTLFKGYALSFGTGATGGVTSGAQAGTPFNLTLDLFDLLILPGGASFAGVRDLESEGPGEVQFNGNVTTQGSQTYINGQLTLTADTVLTAGSTFANGSIVLGTTANPKALNSAAATGPFALTLVTGTSGQVTINEPIGTTHAITSLTATTQATTGQTSVANSEPVTINVPTTTGITTVGSQQYGSLVLSGTPVGTTTLASTGTADGLGITVYGATTAGGNSLTANVASATGASSFGDISGANALSFTLGGTTNFAAVGAASLGYSGATGNFNGAVNLTGAIGVIGSAAVTFGSTLTAGSSVISSGLGTTEFDGAVHAGSLTVENGTGVTLHAGTVTTTGEQDYAEAVTLTSDNQLVGQGAGAGLGTTDGSGVAVNFGSTVTGDFALSLSNTPNATSGGVSNTIFSGAVGTLASLSTSPVGTTFINGGGVTTTDGTLGQVYNGPTLLGAATTLTAANNGPVDFKGATATLGSAVTPQALTITTGGVTTFDGVVGGDPGAATDARTAAPALASLTFTAGGGAVDINGPAAGTSVTTVTTPGGTQNYGTSQVVLGTNTLFKGYGFSFGGGITSGTQAGTPFNLTLDFFGLTTLGGSSLAGIRNLTTEGPGELQLAGTVATQGTQTYGNGKITLTGDTLLQAGTTVATAGIALNAPVDDATIGADSLTLITGTGSTGVAINSPIGATTPIGSLLANSQQTTGQTSKTTEPVTVAGLGITTVGSQTYGALILGGLVGATTTLTSTATSGAVGINAGPVTGNGQPLTVNVASTDANSTIGAITGAGTLTLNMQGTTGIASISDPLASLAYTGGTVNFGAVTVTGAGINAAGTAAFASTLTASGGVTSNGTGATVFDGNVQANSLTVKNGTGVTLAAGTAVVPGTVTTTGEQDYEEPVTLGTAMTLSGRGTGLGTTGSNGLALNFTQAITGDFALVLANTSNATAGGVSNTVFGAAVGTLANPLASLNVNAVGTTFINGGGVTTNGPAGQLYNGPVVIGAAGIAPTTTLTANNGGPINFANATATLTSLPGTLQAVALNTSGLITFDALVGGTPDTSTTAAATAPALASLTTGGGGTVDINGGGVVTAAGQSYGGPVVLSADTILKGGSLTLSSGLAGQTHALTLNFASQITLPDAITGVGTFASVGLGGVLLNGAFTTTGTQTYTNGAITLMGTAALTSTLGDLVFYTPINGNGSLALSAPGTAAGAGQAIFNANALVGNGTPVGAFTSNTANGTLFGMTAGNSTVGKGGINAASVAVTGPVTFGEAGSTLTNNNHPSVVTTAAQTYNGAATLSQDTSLVSSGGAAVTFNAGGTIDSATAADLRALNVNTAGTTTFGGLIGAVNALGGLTTGPGLTAFTMTIPNGSTAAAGVLVDGAVTTGGPASFAVTGSSLAQPSVLTLGGGAQTYGTLTNPAGTAVILAGPVTVLNSADTLANGVFTGGGTITFNGNIVSAGGTPELDVRAGVGTTIFDGSVYTTGDFAPGGASVVFNGAVGTPAAPVGVFTVEPNNGGTGTPRIDLNGGTYSSGGSLLFSLPTLLSANTILLAGGNITFGSTLDGNNPLSPYSLTIDLSGGTVAFNGVVGGAVPLASLTVGNLGATLGTARFAMSLAGLGANQGGVNVYGAVNIFTNADFEATGATVPTILSGVTKNNIVGTGTQTYGQPGSAAGVVLGQNTILQDLAAAGGITFNGTVNAATNGGAALSVNAVGDETFNRLVGNTGALASLATDNFAGTTVGGSTRFNMDLTAAGTVGGVRVAGPVSIGDAVVFNAAGGFALPTVLSGGAQTYARAATVNQNAVLTATSGDITFVGTVDSGATAQTLQVNTPGNEVFGGLVGAASALANLVTDGAGTVGGQTEFVMAKPASAGGSGVGGVNVSGNLVVNDGVLFQVGGTQATGAALDPSVVTGGSQTYHGAAVLGNQTLLTSGAGSIAFGSTVDSLSAAAPQQLTLLTSAAGSTISFAGAVGGADALAGLLTQGGGTTVLNGGSITTVGEQRFDNAVLLGQDAVLRSTGASDITFNGSLDGSRNLEVDASTANFHSVGLAVPLLNLTVNAPALTSFFYAAAPGSTSVNLAGVLTVNGPVDFLSAGTAGVSFVRTGVALPGVTIASGQAYNGAFALQGTASFNDLRSGNITFAQGVDGSGANANLTVGTGGTISFLNPVGAATPLASLTVNDLGLTTGRAVLGGGSIVTTGAQVFNDAVFLNAGTTLTSTAGGAIAFALTLDSATTAAPQALAVNTAGQTIFDGAVGATNALASVTTDNEGAADAGTVFNGGSVTTTGAQVYKDAATLDVATTLTSTAGGNVRFATTVDSNPAGAPQALAVNTAGETIFGGLVGAAGALASVTTDNEGAADQGTFINGGGVATTGAQTYNDGVTLGAAATLASAANGALTFNGTVNGPFALTLDTGGLTVFNNLVGNTAALAALTTDNAGVAGEATQFNMTVGTDAVAGVVVNGPVTINDGVAFNVKGASLTQPGVLTVGNAAQTFNGPVTLGTSTFLTSAAAIPTTAGAFTGGGAILFASAQGIVSAGGNDLFVRAGVGTTTFASAINARAVDLGGAAVTFRGPVSLQGTLSVEPNGNAPGGSIDLNGGSLTTVGAQTYNVPFLLGGDTVLTSTGGGDITFLSTVDGAHALTLNSTGNEIFGGQVGSLTALASLTTDNPAVVTPGGSVEFAFAGGTTASPSVTTTGAQVYNDEAILRADTVLASTAGSIDFARTVDSDAAGTPRALTLNAAGDEIFNDRVGATAALLSLTTDDPTGTLAGGRVVFNIAGSTTALPGVTTTTFQTYNDAAILQTDTVLASTAAGALTFNSTVDSATASAPRALTLNTADNEVFRGVVGGTAPLLSLTTDDPAANLAGGKTVFAIPGGGASVTTTTFQTYHDAVALRAATLLASATLTFVSTVDGAFALTLDTAGVTTFQNTVGGLTPLASLTTAAGPVVFDGGAVTTTGLQSYGGTAVLGVDTTLASTAAGGGVTFNSTVDSSTAAAPRALTVNAAGDETFKGRVGATAPLLSLTTDDPASGVAGGNVVFAIATAVSPGAPSVTTTAFQTYNDAATLQADTVLASTGGGTLTFANTLDGGHALTLDSRGDEVFGNTVGGQTPLFSLTTDDSTGAAGGGRTIFGLTNGTVPIAVTTTTTQTYNDAVLLQAATTLASNGAGALTFAQTIDGAQTLAVNSRGDEDFMGQIGHGTALASLTTDGDPKNAGGNVNFFFAGTETNPSVTTSGAQTYNDAAVLHAGTALVSNNGRALTFNAAVDNNNFTHPYALVVATTGNAVFNGLVGAVKPIGDLTVDASGSATGQAIFNMDLSTRPKNATGLAAVNVNGDVTIKAAALFNTKGLGDGSPTVASTGPQTYDGAITLSTDTILASSRGGALTAQLDD